VRGDEFEARLRSHEWFHQLAVLPGAWTILRVDGRSFSRFTEGRYDKPFDPRFSELMTGTAATVLTEFNGRYAYTESDEISVLLDPSFQLFGRSVEKLVSVSAGIASAAFTYAAGEPAHFDSRVWMGTGPDDVIDYFSWRQADAARVALNGWCYWTLRRSGNTPQEATTALQGSTATDKTDLLQSHGITFTSLPTWQRAGIGLWWQQHDHPGYDPIRRTEVVTARRRIHTERNLPTQQAYRNLIARLAQP
jgi:tRNA(His) guanylyltransferase